MLPKILITASKDRESIRKFANFKIDDELGYDGEVSSIKDFREWLSFAYQVCLQDNHYLLAIWNLDRMSKECQSLLLKPLEEKKDGMKVFLIAQKEAGILPTIRSRCSILKIDKEVASDFRWSEVVSCWRSGPAECIKFAEACTDREIALKILEEVVEKLGREVRKKVNKQRLKVLDLAFESLTDLGFPSVNPRLCMEDFLIRSWVVIKG